MGTQVNLGETALFSIPAAVSNRRRSDSPLPPSQRPLLEVQTPRDRWQVVHRGANGVEQVVSRRALRVLPSAKLRRLCIHHDGSHNSRW